MATLFQRLIEIVKAVQRNLKVLQKYCKQRCRKQVAEWLSGGKYSGKRNLANICFLQKWVNRHSLIISREGWFLTLSILPCPQERISWSTPCKKIDDERMSVLHQNWEIKGNSSLPPSRFPSGESGYLLVVGDGFPKTSLVLVEHTDIPMQPRVTLIDEWWVISIVESTQS